VDNFVKNPANKIASDAFRAGFAGLPVFSAVQSALKSRHSAENPGLSGIGDSNSSNGAACGHV
jgi:hypothetical protein